MSQDRIDEGCIMTISCLCFNVSVLRAKTLLLEPTSETNIISNVSLLELYRPVVIAKDPDA